MIDFNSAVEVFNNYKGSEKKKTLIYNNTRYLVKFPDPIIRENTNLSFKNNAFSEYVGSNVFQLSGFKTQNTILGKYTYNGKEKIVCACEDFTDNENILYEFENLALSTNPDKKIGTELIKGIQTKYSPVYLWVYKQNIRAYNLYKRLGFEIQQETETRYFMKYLN